MFGIGDKDDEYVRILGYAVMIAIIAGVVTAAVITFYSESESYSALHIDEYSNYIENGTVSFTYGVDRFGPSGAYYEVKALHRGRTVYSDAFEMRPGSVMKNVSFSLSETEFPVKLQLVLKEGQDTYYETYFWLKGNK